MSIRKKYPKHELLSVVIDEVRPYASNIRSVQLNGFNHNPIPSFLTTLDELPGYDKDKFSRLTVKSYVITGDQLAIWLGRPVDADKARKMLIPVARLRRQAEMTQQQLADKAGGDIRLIQRLESGEIQAGNITLKNAVAIAAALGVNPDLLLEE